MQCRRAVESHAGKSLRKTSVMYGTREETAIANTKSKSLNLQPCWGSFACKKTQKRPRFVWALANNATTRIKTKNWQNRTKKRQKARSMHKALCPTSQTARRSIRPQTTATAKARTCWRDAKPKISKSRNGTRICPNKLSRKFKPSVSDNEWQQNKSVQNTRTKTKRSTVPLSYKKQTF